MLLIIFILLWFLLGVIGFILISTYHFRGNDFDENYFPCGLVDIVFTMMLCLIGGGAVFIVGITTFIYQAIKRFLLKKYPESKGFVYNFTYVLYKICNIGVKKDEDSKTRKKE